MEIGHEYTKKRMDFGRQTMFCEQGPEMCDSITTNPVEFKSFILRNPVHREIQYAPDFSQNTINTVRAEYTNMGVNHSEGGWPKDINVHDPEATQRYRRRVEKEDNYIHCVQNQAPAMEHYLLQNNAVEMYTTYFCDIAQANELEHASIRTVNVFRDKRRRPVTSLNWEPHGHHFCVSYVDVDFYRHSRQPVTADIWDMNKANYPQTVFDSTIAIFDLRFSPRNVNILVGGLATGQVALFDSRNGGFPVNICPNHVAHRDLVKQILFIQSKTGKEFFSSSPDGMCKWWDLRNLEEPTDEMIIDVVHSATESQDRARACGVSIMEYEPTIPTRFMVGTDNGLVIGGNRKGKSPLEQLPIKYEVHLGPVRSLERNPYYPKNFLTVGDWTLKVWSEDCRESPILWSKMMRHHYNKARWSPTRMSLILLAGSDGQLYIWDILRNQHESILSMKLCDEPLLSLDVHEHGSLLILGNGAGQIYLTELSSSLTESEKHEKAQMSAVFDRESKRERILEARSREIRLKLRQAEEGSPHGSISEMDNTVGDKDLNEATTEYMQILKKELAALM